MDIAVCIETASLIMRLHSRIMGTFSSSGFSSTRFAVLGFGEIDGRFRKFLQHGIQIPPSAP